ncbi:hypothetical protein P3X46_011753 [Hevea brasiliensis]|uniref:CCHC-type domain-containing protein n=1 Tax=Hevea brasiliensis TaxID=3981 RepID=A0ABQ9M9Y5_HEVBR|nr:hypothetical protein P3X46_011753 [Hevea brasiliensis]
MECLWKPLGRYTVIDLDNDYFFVRFQKEEDVEKSLMGGPWVVFGHYLTVQKWSPDFDLATDFPAKVVVWVRIGAKVGKVIKVDDCTILANRGKFACLEIEIDITKPLYATYSFKGNDIKIEYENVSPVCLTCGSLGHSLHNCPTKNPGQNGNSKSVGEGSRFGVLSDMAEDPMQQNDRDNVNLQADVLKFASGASKSPTKAKKVTPGPVADKSGPAFTDPEGPYSFIFGSERKRSPSPTRAKGLNKPPNAKTIDPKSTNLGLYSVARLDKKGPCVDANFNPILQLPDSGAAKPGFLRVFKEWFFSYCPSVCIIVKPRISGVSVDKVIMKMGFLRSHRVECIGFSGGIWILWNPSIFAVSIIHLQSHHRRRLWPALTSIANSMVDPWCVVGDFNCIAYTFEKQGGSPANASRCRESWAWIDSCGVEERLDRALCNIQWRMKFPNATVYHLQHLNSDHCPLIIKLSLVTCRRQPQFKFLEAWLLDNSFGAVVDLAWTSSSSMKDCTTSFTRAAYTWNQDIFRCIRRKNEQFLRRISGVERALSVHLTSVYLTNIERSLKDEFNTNLA